MSGSNSGERSARALEEMAGQFRELVHAMAADDGHLELDAVVQYALAAVTEADDAGIMVSRDLGKPETLGATGELPRQVDELQYRTGQGPCLAALRHNDIVLVNDLATDDQFPRFSPEAARLGVGSMLSSRLFLSAQDRAALNYYSLRPGAFSPDQLPLAAIFASYASLLLMNKLQRDRTVSLERALESNREIATALGILMAERDATQEEALDSLIHASQHLNRRLRDIAADVNRTRQLPDTRTSRARGTSRRDTGEEG